MCSLIACFSSSCKLTPMKMLLLGIKLAAEGMLSSSILSCSTRKENSPTCTEVLFGATQQESSAEDSEGSLVSSVLMHLKNVRGQQVPSTQDCSAASTLPPLVLTASKQFVPILRTSLPLRHGDHIQPPLLSKLHSTNLIAPLLNVASRIGRGECPCL